MVAGFSVLSLALDAQTDIVTTQRMVSDIEIKKQQEQFGVLAVVNENNFLTVGIDNQGQNPVEISSLWIINKTLPGEPATRYSINYDDAFIPAGFTSEVILPQALEIIPEIYDIKTVSSFGTIKTVELVVGAGFSSGGLRAELMTDPPDVVIGKNVTVAMIVTNTGEGLIQDVQPEMQPLGGSGTEIASTSHTPPSVNLERGESVMFSWDYQVTGNSGDDLIFSAIARGDYMSIDDVSSNVVSDVSVLRVAGDGGGGESEEVVIKDELFGRPDIFLTYPSPLGWNDGERALWGVNVANPTDQPIYVSRVVIVALPTASTSGAASFTEICEDKGNYQAPVTVSPTPSNWSCPAGNQLQWEDMNNPQEISPRSVFPFFVRIGSNNIASPANEANNLPITASVFSTLGQFGKAGYMTTMVEESVALPNVFLSTAVGTANPANIIGNMTGITEGDTVTFNATIADMDTGTSYYIHPGSRLVVNIPKDWTYTGINSYTGFTIDVETYPDESTQIIGTLITTDPPFTGAGDDARTIQFTATAPDVSKAKMYVMHILADGSARGDAGHDYSIGALSEAILQVCPDTGCPTNPT